ncbi:hypothetical protein [Acinetobacter piscicola]|uniref:hypothetical protein n=1 Tax=Acinetobacter piscicola TaxID=2006115 RepID=UPI00101FDC26|nr:hypothetical protein [Acinetobacter piscicola]RYL22985.1 hypothetical protein EWP19_16010 [Acinetobacter piscicola]
MTIRLKKMCLGLFGLVLLLSGVVFWLIQDEPISQNAMALLADVRLYETDLKQDPYFLWLGFDAKTDAEQQLLGQKIYHRDWKNFYQTNSVYIDEPIEKFSELQGDFLTEADEKVFEQLIKDLQVEIGIEAYQKQQRALEEIYSRQSVLNARWQALLHQAPTQKVLVLSVEGAIPNFTLMMKIHRLYVAHLLFQQDVAALVRYTEALIAKDQSAVSLLDKMIMLNLISDNIELIHQLNQRLGQKHTLSELSLAQMSMRFPFASETAVMQQVTNRLVDRQSPQGLFDFIYEDENQQKSVEKHPIADFFTPLLLLKNQSLNRYVSYIYPTLVISELPNPQFKQALQQPHDSTVKRSWLKNFMGNKLVDVALPRWETYAIRPRLINQKIVLLNVLAQHQAIDLARLNQNTQGYAFYQTKTALCIKTPNPYLDEEEQRKYGSCLKLED